MKIKTMVLLSTLALSGICQASVEITAGAQDTTGIRNYQSNVPSSHQFHIINQSSAPIKYTLYVKVCVLGHGCNERQWDQSVSSGAKFDLDFPIQLTTTINQTGTYQVVSTTAVIGHESKTVTGLGSLWIPN